MKKESDVAICYVDDGREKDETRWSSRNSGIAVMMDRKAKSTMFQITIGEIRESISSLSLIA